MSDKLQFVAGFRHCSTAESPDKLKFVGHFGIRQQYQSSVYKHPNNKTGGKVMKLHRYFQVVAITLALIFANSAPAYYQSPQNNQASAPQIRRLKNQVLKIGVGEDITVILFSG